MVLIGEVPIRGNVICPDCESILPLKVLRSNAGYYIGRQCDNCGPFSRESGYYNKKEDAEKALQEDLFSR